jgi:predicted transcriptional regulator
MAAGVLQVGVSNLIAGRQISFADAICADYDKFMAKANKFEIEDPMTILDEEDEETLAAIDEGIEDAKAGRTVSAEKVRERLPKWTTASSTRKGH